MLIYPKPGVDDEPIRSSPVPYIRGVDFYLLLGLPKNFPIPIGDRFESA